MGILELQRQPQPLAGGKGRALELCGMQERRAEGRRRLRVHRERAAVRHELKGLGLVLTPEDDVEGAAACGHVSQLVQAVVSPRGLARHQPAVVLALSPGQGTRVAAAAAAAAAVGRDGSACTAAAAAARRAELEPEAGARVGVHGVAVLVLALGHDHALAARHAVREAGATQRAHGGARAAREHPKAHR